MLNRENINIGCGNSRYKDYLGVDIEHYEGYTDVKSDGLLFLRGLKDKSISKIYSSHFFEHINDPTDYLQEIDRVLKKGGIFTLIVPHFSNAWYYSDPTHREGFFWGYYTILYYLGASKLRINRQLPTYLSLDNCLKVEKIDLLFSTIRPYYLRQLFLKILEKLINRSSWLQELWEERFCWLLPCHSLKIEIKKL